MEKVMEKKYEFTGEVMTYEGHTLHRIKAIKCFGDVKSGDLGGWIESEKNLDQGGRCWVYDSAKVFGNAVVCGDAEVNGAACILGDAVVQSTRDYVVFKNWWSSSRYITWTKSNDTWHVNYFFHGKAKDLISKAYQESELSGRMYEHTVKFLESIKDEFNK